MRHFIITAILALALTSQLAFAASLPVRLKYTTTQVTTSVYQELVALTQRGVKAVSVLNTGPNAVELAVGAAGSEVVQIVVPGTSQVAAPAMVALPMVMGYGARLSVIALDGANSTGELQLNLLYN